MMTSLSGNERGFGPRWVEVGVAALRYLATAGASDDPTGRVRVRVQDYAIKIADASYLTIRNLRFFATTIFARASDGAKVRMVSFH